MNLSKLDPQVLAREFLPCHWCGGEIDYNGQPGSPRSFSGFSGQPAHYVCDLRRQVAG